jgi:heavy metal translocating P-type ATPase
MSSAPTDEATLSLSAAERHEIRRRLLRDLLGAALLGWSALHQLWRPGEGALSAGIAAAGALLVGLPVLWRGGLGLLQPGGVRFTDQLVALATFAALCDGQLATATLVPLVFDLGRLFEERSALGLRAAIASLQRLSARSATQISALGGGADDERRVDPAALRPGDLLRVRPGEIIATDAIVRAGASTVDQAALTGESAPEEVDLGARVFAGSLNLSGLLELEVQAPAADSALGRVARLLAAVDAARPAALRQLDRYARALLPLVLVAAAGVLVWTEDMGRAIAVLVAAAPTGLVVAGPVTFIAALTAAARRDLLIKGAGFLEALPLVDAVVFDKTGTLTTGRVSVLGLEPAPGVPLDLLLGAGAGAAFGSMHPAARALTAAAAEAGVAPWPAERWRELPGLGVEAESPAGLLRLGRAAWVGAPAGGGAAEVWVRAGERLLGRARLGDSLRPDAAETLRALRAEGIDQLHILTGDGAAEAARVADALAAAGAQVDTVEAGVLPEGKLAAIERLSAGGASVLMVGDGVNDALALAAAQVGVAFGLRRSEVVLGGADVAIQSERLVDVVALLRLSREVRRILHQNIALALIWNLGLMAAAAAGALPPLAAAALQHLGAVWVVANAARLLRAPAAAAPAAAPDLWALDGEAPAEPGARAVDRTEAAPAAAGSPGQGERGAEGGRPAVDPAAAPAPGASPAQAGAGPSAPDAAELPPDPPERVDG